MNLLDETQGIRTYSKNAELVREKRDLIASKALSLFLKKGYTRTTIRELAAACDLTEGAIYRYIGSKDDILHLFIPEVRVSVFLEYFHNLGDMDIIYIFKKCIWRYYTWQDETADRNIFFNREINNFTPEDRKALLKSQSDYIHFFEDLIKKGIALKKFKTADPLLLAHNIVMGGYDWALRNWFLKHYFSIDDYIRKQTDMFLTLLVPINKQPN